MHISSSHTPAAQEPCARDHCTCALTDGRLSVHGVAWSTLGVALTTTTGAVMTPKPFVAHLQTFYTFRSNQCGAVLLQRPSESRERKLSVLPPLPPNHFLLPFVCRRLHFFPLCIRKVSVGLRRSIPTHHGSSLRFSGRQMWPFHSGKCHLMSCTEEI